MLCVNDSSLVWMTIAHRRRDIRVTCEPLQSLDVLSVFSGVGQKRVTQSVQSGIFVEFVFQLLYLLHLAGESVAAERLRAIFQSGEHVRAFRLSEQTVQGDGHVLRNR